ncbi:signal peptidase I [Maridesulfovibrio ferrireducens]|uniref:Signal peptidase I n=1 Tax=Maridesulfovibrio ferrireducens TaxID=246191 RepID=A0A1G9CYL1_9BACT|nr:signal peptidase I [Maridesulfovibrio ferrireducens]SDK56750.1 signal peptidase I [Maridesulfovibrio ferrireducens]
MNPRWQSTLKEYIEALFIALLLALFIRTFIVQAFKIPSGSMLQTLQIGDHLLVNKFTYGVKIPFTSKVVIEMGDPEYKDIIVFKYPGDTSKDYIKRVIGVPGDTVEIKNKKVFVNGNPLVEPYTQFIDNAHVSTLRDNMPPRQIPAGEYFVMGDNRDGSNDSRFWGNVPRDNILGKAWIIYWSWGGPDSVRWNRLGSLLH